MRIRNIHEPLSSDFLQPKNTHPEEICKLCSRVAIPGLPTSPDLSLLSPALLGPREVSEIGGWREALGKAVGGARGRTKGYIGIQCLRGNFFNPALVFIFDDLVKSRNSKEFVIPAKAGIQLSQDVLDPGFRRGDAPKDFSRDHHLLALFIFSALSWGLRKESRFFGYPDH